MEFLLILIAVFLIVRGAITQVGKSLFSKNDFYSEDNKSSINIHNHIQENHLHISKEDLKSITNKD